MAPKKEKKCVEDLFVTLEGQRHRVDIDFFSNRPNLDSPTPSPVGECVPLLLVRGGGGHTRLRKRRWGIPIWTRGQTQWYFRYLCTVLCGQRLLFELIYPGLILVNSFWRSMSNKTLGILGSQKQIFSALIYLVTALFSKHRHPLRSFFSFFFF